MQEDNGGDPELPVKLDMRASAATASMEGERKELLIIAEEGARTGMRLSPSSVNASPCHTMAMASDCPPEGIFLQFVSISRRLLPFPIDH